ncbi:unnamed protein product, partial [Phaeothamnion confervicola]
PEDVPTLYVNLQRCQHSNDLLFAVTHQYKLHVNVVDVSREIPPSWLPGTPTFVHGRSVFCGDGAFAFAQSFADSVAQSNGVQKSIAAVIAEGGVPTSQKRVGGKKASRGAVGTSITDAFKPVTEQDENAITERYAESTDARLQRLMSSR